jgi:hypothetical protein
MLLPQDSVRENWLNQYRHRAGGVKDLLCIAVTIRSSELSPVKKKQDDSYRSEDECDAEPLLSCRRMLCFRLKAIS